MFIELEKTVINSSLIESYSEESVWFAGSDTPMKISLDDYNRIRQKTLPNPRKAGSPMVDTRLQDFFIKLHRLTGGKGTPVFNLSRERKLKELMTKHSLSEEMLINAAKNIGEDPYLQGKDPNNSKRYGDIDYLLRPDKAMKWAEANPVVKKKGMFNG